MFKHSDIVKIKTSLIFPFLLVSCMACQESSNTEFSYKVVDAPEWTALFKRSSGWFGGDGIFAIPMSGKEYHESEDSTKNIILFSDTMIGEIEGDSLHPGYHMVNNSIAILEGRSPKEEKIRFYLAQDSTGKDQSVFIPNLLPPLAEGEYYWLGDGFVNPVNQHTYVFAYRVVNNPKYDVFQFDVIGGAIIVIPPGSEFPFADHRQIALPYFHNREAQLFGSYGAGILLNTESAGMPNPDGYIYIYGVDDPGKQMLVARVKPKNFENLKDWRFWDGNTWNEDFQKAASISDNVSNELSVTPLPNGKYLLVSQVGAITDATVGIRIGDSPIGPFGPTQVIWDCAEAIEEPEFIAYNAKAHPSLSKPGELLISYNVNSFKFWDQIEAYPYLYRPRFFRLIFN